MSHRILLAEDDPATREGYVEFLSECGYSVAAVIDGREALRSIQRQPPDALVTDLNMPHLDGLALAARMRERPRTRAIPIVALTGDLTPGRSRQAQALNVTIILKPCTPAHLQAELARLLAASQ
jgi:CheY-like chemotaxis protein